MCVLWTIKEISVKSDNFERFNNYVRYNGQKNNKQQTGRIVFGVSIKFSKCSISVKSGLV